MSSVADLNVLFGVLVILYQPVFGLDEGNACIVQPNEQRGLCRVITECPLVIANLRKRIMPTNCGSFQGRYPIVCCPQAVEPAKTEVPTGEIERISAKKCREYGSAVFELRTLRAVDGQLITKNDSVCNMDASTYIVNGVETRHGEFPHMALLGYEQMDVVQWRCGGSLISEYFVLTAAHCLRAALGPPKQVALGMHNINDAESSRRSTSGTDDPDVNRAQLFGVVEIFSHPDYKQRINAYNDIGLIRLDRRVTFNPYMRPACLPAVSSSSSSPSDEPLPQPLSAVASGWGNTEYKGSRSERLMKVKLDLYSATECNATYTIPYLHQLPIGIADASQICAGSRSEQKDTCQGDSGGPLQIQHPDETVYCMFSLLGVTSLGKGCGRVNTPSVYTRVAAFVPWIEGIVWAAV